jgi:bile acid:Na+ symporter, BASS family
MDGAPSWFAAAVQVAVAAVAFAVGLSAGSAELTALRRKPRLIGKALVAVLLLVPAIAVLLVKGVQPPTPVAGGILIAALSIGPVAALKRSRKNDPERDVALGLNLVLLLVSVIFVPAAVWLVGLAFGRDFHVGPGAVANTILPLQLVPLFAGIALSRAAPKLAARLERPVTLATNLALAIVAVAIAVVAFDSLVGLGGRAWALIATFAAMSMLVGHALGGPSPGTRMVVATFSALRFPALGLTIARVAANRDVVPVLLAYVLCSVVMLAVYLAIERAAHQGEAPDAPPHGV